MKKKILGLAAPVALVAALFCSGAAFADEAVVADAAADQAAGTIEAASVIDEQALDGWKQIDGKWYHFTSGSADTNQFIANPNGAGYRYLGDDGAAVTGWYKVSSGSGYYWIWADQSYTLFIGGWKTIAGKQYYFYDYELVQSDYIPNPTGTAYAYAGADGAMVTGWYKVPSGSGYYWIYADPTGTLKNDGWLKIDNKWYYFVDTELVQNDFIPSLDGTKEFYVGPDGALVKGWVKIPDGGGSYFWGWGNDDGTLLEYGWVKDGGKWYYIGGYSMVTNTSIPSLDGKKWYYLGSNGAMVTGWYKDAAGWIWADADGVMKTAGWKQIDGKWYYFNSGYMMQDTTIVNAKGTNVYAVGTNGAMVTDAWFNDSGDWYYLGSDGLSVTGWKKINNKWYYLVPSEYGCMAASRTMTIDGKTYIFDAKGGYTKI